MQKVIFLSTLALLAMCTTQAQIKQDPAKTAIKRTAPTSPPAPPPAPVNKTTGAESTPALVYNLTAVRVKIRTGNDNKEFPSKVYAMIVRRSSVGEGYSFSQLRLDNEMKINSDTEFGLERITQNQTATRLDAFQSSGLRLVIQYLPNFFLDAWKIESITLVLEFKDQFGNLHPTLGSKTIVFSNAYGFLNSEYWQMECDTDGSFAPITAIIKKL